MASVYSGLLRKGLTPALVPEGQRTTIRGGGKRVGETHVGQALKNSARLADKQISHTPEMTNPHSTADGPPDGRAIDKLADNAVHEFKMANARPSIDLQRAC